MLVPFRGALAVRLSTLSLRPCSLAQAADAWWTLVLREETLGRIVWIVENTLSTALLERA